MKPQTKTNKLTKTASSKQGLMIGHLDEWMCEQKVQGEEESSADADIMTSSHSSHQLRSNNWNSGNQICDNGSTNKTNSNWNHELFHLDQDESNQI